MKIHISDRFKEKAWGGGHQFMKAFRNYLISQDLFEADPSNASVILFNSYPFRKEEMFKRLLKLKQDNKIIIHRVDGPVSSVRGNIKWRSIDEIIYRFNKLAADGTIFQSKWSMKKNRQHGMKSNKYEVIILNGTDPSVFDRKEEFPIGKKVKIVCSSWSSNWNKGFRIYKYLDKNLDYSNYEMYFIGNSPIRFKNITHVKPVASKELSTKLKTHDIYITASVNDPCSNSLIEAISVGLPVIAINSGGNPEILEIVISAKTV